MCTYIFNMFAIVAIVSASITSHNYHHLLMFGLRVVTVDYITAL